MARAVNPDFARFEREPPRERAAVFEAAARAVGVSPQAIEKDYWVCRTIDALFKGMGPNTRPKVFFKGGTSLSKAFGLIRRFSEDIDIVYSRSGLNVERDPMAGSRRLGSDAIKLARKDIGAKARARTHGPVCKMLAAALDTCAVEPFAVEKESSCALSITYKSILPADDYLKPYVEVQCGAKSDPEPSTDLPIEAYIHAQLTGWNLRTEGVSIINPERTFLEKLFAIHAEALRFEDKRTLADRNRLSRHYYDVAMLHEKAVAKRALEDRELFDAVWDNQRIMWGKSAAVMSKAKPGSFTIMPPTAMRGPLSRDYSEMQRMMFRKPPPPDFRWILDELEKLDDAVNKRLL